MAYLNEIQLRGEIKDARQVMEYLYQLEDQIRYALQNLDGENIQAGAIGENLLSGGIRNQIKTAQRTADSATAANVSTAAQVTRQGDRITNQGERITSLETQIARLNSSAAKKLEGSGPFSVYVGSEQPEGHSVLWVQLGTEPDEDGLMDCTLKYIP